MKNLFHNLFVISLFFIITFSGGCKKDEQSIAKTNSMLDNYYPYDWEEIEGTTIANEDNPFDSIGFQHNVNIQIIESLCTENTSFEEMYSICDSVLVSNYGDLIGDEFSSENESSIYIEIMQNEEGETLIDTSNISQLQKDSLVKLIDIIYTYDLTNFSDVIANIKTLENSMIEDYSVSEINIFLFATSIARFSLAYWHDRLTEDKGHYGKAASWPWKKITIAVVDVAAGLGSAAASSVTGPALVGVAITTSVAASSAAGKVWDIFAE